MSTTPATASDPAANALAIVQRLEGAPERAADGKFAPKEQPSEPVAPVAEASTPAETTAPTAPDPAQVKALTALRRAKVPASVLAGLDDETRLSWGTELAKSQADVDRMLRTKSKDPTPNDEGPGAVDDDGEVDPEAKAPGQPESDETVEDQEPDPAAVILRDMIAMQARAQLAGEFPELSKPETWAVVRAKAVELFESGDYDEVSDDWSVTAETIMRDALYATGLRPSPKSSSPARNASQPRQSKPQDRFTALKGTPRHLLTLKLMENEGMTPQQAREVADALGAS